MKKTILLITAVLFILSCSTSNYIKLPEGSELKIKRGDELPYKEGIINRTPLSWSSAGGIPYKIEKDGEVIQEGRLRAKFRVASIFWPPAALLYWPMGFRFSCYDLTGDVATQCSYNTIQELKSKNIE